MLYVLLIYNSLIGLADVRRFNCLYNFFLKFQLCNNLKNSQPTNFSGFDNIDSTEKYHDDKVDNSSKKNPFVDDDDDGGEEGEEESGDDFIQGNC